jgi:cytochrome c oxidase subunit 4
MSSSSTGHIEKTSTYFTIFILLLVFLFASVAVAYLDLGEALGLLMNLGIAGIKATLVVLFFMHGRHNKRLLWVIGGLLLALVLFLSLTYNDYLFRDMLYNP